MLLTLTMPRNITYLALLLALLFSGLSQPTHAAETTIEARLEPGRIALGDAALLTLTIHGQRSAEPELPDVEGLRITPLGSSTQIHLVNGSLSSAVTLTYRVQPGRTGMFTLPPIKIRDKGQTWETKPLRLEVVAAANARPGPGTGGTPVRPPSATAGDEVGVESGQLLVEPEKNEIYSGELLPITIRGYFRQDRRVTVKGQPALAGNGFILESLDEEPVQEEIVRDGAPLVRLTWHGAVSAIRKGEAALRMTLPITVLVPERRRPPVGMFNDPFLDLDSFFTRYRKKETTLKSQPVSILVRPLPGQNRPHDFSGAIGTFSLQVQATPTTVKPGDPINLTITISGRGNFDQVKAPLFTGPDKDWKIYPPSRGELSTGNTAHDQGGKTKKFEQVIVPRHPGLREIPALRFSYFDPDKKQYQTLTTKPISLRMPPASQAARDNSGSDGAAAEKGQGTPKGRQEQKSAPDHLRQAPLPLAPIHTEFGQGVHVARPLWRKTWFRLTVATLILLLMLTLVLTWQRRLRDLNGEGIAGKKRSQETAAELRRLEEEAARGEVAAFLAQLRQVIQNHCGRQWQCETRAITSADLARRIGTDSRLTSLLRACEHAVYAPPELSRTEMEQMVAELKKELSLP